MKHIRFMQSILAIILCLALLLTGCSQPRDALPDESVSTVSSSTFRETPAPPAQAMAEPRESDRPQFDSLDDEDFLAHIEDLVYTETVTALDSEEHFVEGVHAIYVSNEYLDETAFNSQANLYFGYSLDELNQLFQGTRYVFTLDDNGETVVQELQEIEDVTAGTIIRNVAIGSGVILLCVTVSVVSAGVGAPAVSIIFAASAGTATSFALSSAGFGGISAGIIRSIQTGDFNEALKATALEGSEGFKWGAISGSILGGAGEAFVLKMATKSGLSMNEAAVIQADSKVPVDVISQIHSLDEYIVYREAGLQPIMVNGRTALVQNIDLDYVSKLPNGTEVTNLVRMKEGYAPIDPITGRAYQLHHIGQKSDATLAVLTESQHKGNAAILNIFGKDSEIDRSKFDVIREKFWEYMGNVVFANGEI